MDITDLKLVDAIREGELEAFHELYLRYSDLIYRNIRIRVNSSFEADDIFQDFFIKLWEKREHLHIESNVRAYLLIALKHHIFNTIKEQQIRVKYHEACGQTVSVAEDYTWSEVVSHDLSKSLRDIVETFPPRLKTVYMLSREQHLSVREIAQKLSISEQTVKNQLTSILKKLKAALDRNNFIFFI